MSRVVTDKRRRSNNDLINRITLIKGDLTQQDDVDALVSSISRDMKVSGSLNYDLIKKAGQKLDDFILENIYKPRPGDAFPIPGFGLPVKHLIYTVTPDWQEAMQGEDRDLLHCYRQAMGLAHRMGLKRIAFPALGTGRNRYPVARAVRLAVQGITERLTPDFEEVRIVCNKDEVYEAFQERLTKMGWRGL